MRNGTSGTGLLPLYDLNRRGADVRSTQQQPTFSAYLNLLTHQLLIVLIRTLQLE